MCVALFFSVDFSVKVQIWNELEVTQKPLILCMCERERVCVCVCMCGFVCMYSARLTFRPSGVNTLLKIH